MFGENAPILVVDDAVTMRALLRDHLKALGFKNIYEARNVQEAQDTLNRLLTEGNGIELVLCDMNMPGGTGLDFLKTVRASTKTKNLPFLMITTEGQMRIVTEAVMAGVTGYVLKPVSQASLAEKMGEGWRKHHGKK